MAPNCGWACKWGVVDWDDNIGKNLIPRRQWWYTQINGPFKKHFNSIYGVFLEPPTFTIFV